MSKRRITRRPRIPYRPEDDALLFRLYKSGMTISRIARIMGRTVNSVDWRLMAKGLKAMTEGKVPVKETMTYSPRVCLRCHATFQSEGKHNRICLSCKGSSAWRSGSDFEMRV